MGGNPFIHNYGSLNVFNGNTFVGTNAGNFTMTASQNVGIGTVALQSNTTGLGNVAIGQGSLRANTTGYTNTATGSGSLTTNTTGVQNTATGFSALVSNSAGNDNTASGYQALFATTGFSNTAMGSGALQSNSTGSGNIAVGFNAGTNATTGSSNIYIGNGGVAAEGNTIRLGSGSQSMTFISGISGVTVPGGSQVLIDSNGHLGTILSSQRFKYDIQDMGSASNRLLQLRPVLFRYKQAQNDGSHPLQFGLIAEEVAKVYPELVQFAPTGEVNTVLYHLLLAMLLNEAQKQNAQIVALNTEVTTLRAQVRMLEARTDRENNDEIGQLRREVEQLRALVVPLMASRLAVK